jgi:hypothetical protein
MRLKDFYCPICGSIQKDIFIKSLEIVKTSLYCNKCKSNVRFEAVCNGGIKKRYRVNDWPSDPEFYRGQVKMLGVGAGESLDDSLDDSPKYVNGTDEREQRREVLKYATRRKRGKLPIVCDQKVKNG